MNHGFIVLAVLIALAIGFRVLARVLVFLMKRGICRAGLKWVGHQAMAKQPDGIHLIPCTGHVWTNPGAMQVMGRPLPALGFEDAGVFGIQEMAGVYLRLLVQPEQRVAACLYEHPKIGNWIDFFCHRSDGTSFTYTTARPTGLDQRPGCTTVNAPDCTAEALYQRLLHERPARDWIEMTTANVGQRFQDAYARSTAWRRSRGISAEEVARRIQQGPIPKHTPQTSTE